MNLFDTKPNCGYIKNMKQLKLSQHDLRQLAINLLDCEDGVCEAGYQNLSRLLALHGHKDILNKVDAVEDKFYLYETDAEQLRQYEPTDQERFPVGAHVEVSATLGESDSQLSYDFIGSVIDYHEDYAQISDQDGEIFDVDFEQLTHNLGD